MIGNDNSVNIKNAARKYHHGDLREALIESGMRLLAERSAEQLSLREIARDVGVSATAVYRHFPDKQSLLYALCEKGALILAERSEQAMAEAGRGRAGFDATGRAYVRFAVEHPALFRLIMTTKAPESAFSPNVSLVSPAARQLRDNIRELLPSDASEDQQRMAAIHAWSLVHGMAMLMLDGQIPADDAIIDSISAVG